MKLKKSKILGLSVIEPSTMHEDFRGTYTEIYNKYELNKNGIQIEFVQDDSVYSRFNVLRGIHGDYQTTKLISCLFGAFYLVIVDVRKESDDYMKWESFTLSSKNRNSILIPAGYGNAHYILSNEGAIFHYKQTSYYNRIDQFTLNWKDNRVGIYWPCENPILSERDAGNSSF